MPAGLSYAGVDLSPMTEALRIICERWWVDEAPDLWSWPGYALERMHHVPIPGKPHTERARLNTLYWPSCASRWGYFHAIVGDAQAAAIQAAVGTVSPIPAVLSISDGKNPAITPSMFLIAVRPVFVKAPTPATGPAPRLWWITLVCPRYFWYLRQLTYTFAAGDSWSTLLTNLVSAASGLTPTVPSVPSAYGTPSSARWSIPQRPLPFLIDAAAHTVGFRFVYRLDGTAVYLNATTGATDDLANYNNASADVAFGNRNVATDIIGNIPASVAVSFWGDAQTIATKSLASLSLTTQYGSATGVSNTYAWIAADADGSASGTIQTNYTNQAATDFYLWALSFNDVTFRGIQACKPTGLEDRIEWEYQPGRFAPARAPHSFNDLPDMRLPETRVTTRIVPTNWADRNEYGDRPPPGYTYRVKLKARNGSTQQWKSTIRVVTGGVVADGPQLGWGADSYVLYADTTGNVGDEGIAVPDPLSAFTWLFVPSAISPNNTAKIVTEVCQSGTGASLGKCGDVKYSYAAPGADWLIANGAAVSRTTYACLNAIASAAGYAAPWGPGNGSTTFNVPTLTGPPQGYLRIADDTPIVITVERRSATFAAALGDKECTDNPNDCCCFNEFYAGAGWYCTVDPGGNCFEDAKTVQFLSEDPCDTLVICAGPYETEAEALAACTGTFPTCSLAAAALNYHFYSDGCLSGLTGTNMNRIVTGPPTWTWTNGNITSPCSTDVGLTMNCTAGVYDANYNGQSLTLVSQTSTSMTWKFPSIIAPVTGTFAYVVISF